MRPTIMHHCLRDAIRVVAAAQRWAYAHKGERTCPVCEALLVGNTVNHEPTCWVRAADAWRQAVAREEQGKS